MLPARRAARALRGLRPAKPAPVSRAKSQVWAGNDAWRRAPPTSRSFSDKNPLEPEALDRARTAHDRAMEDFRAKLLAECDEMVVRGALPKLSTAQKSLLVDWNLSSE